MFRTQALEIMEAKLALKLPSISKKKIKELALLALDTAEGDIGMSPPEVLVLKHTYYNEFESNWEESLSGNTYTR